MVRRETDLGVLSRNFPTALEALVRMHHILYPRIPPQGIYFEALAEKAFRNINQPFTVIEATERNQPRHDLCVERRRLSLKTETGKSTRRNKITITKLCTTERDPWEAGTLVERVIEHLGRYDLIVMLRAIWIGELFHYQLLEIPVDLLRLIETADFQVVGHRAGRRRSLGADVFSEEEKVFHVHFDASDGKCSIRDLGTHLCTMLHEWDYRVGD